MVAERDAAVAGQAAAVEKAARAAEEAEAARAALTASCSSSSSAWEAAELARLQAENERLLDVLAAVDGARARAERRVAG